MIPNQLKGTLCGSISPLKRQKVVAIFQKATLILLLFLSAKLNAQNGTLKEAVSQNSFYTTCSPSAKPVIQVDMKRTYSAPNANDFLILVIWERPTPNAQAKRLIDFSLGNYAGATKSGQFTLTFNRSSIEMNDLVNAPFVRSFNRRDLIFYVTIEKFEWSTGSQFLVGSNTEDFFLTAGVAPTFEVVMGIGPNPATNQITKVVEPGKRNLMTIYRGNMDTLSDLYWPKIKFGSTSCNNLIQSMVFVWWENDRLTGKQIGNRNILPFFGNYNGNIAWINYKNLGYSFFYNFKPGHSYVLSLEYKGEGIAKTTYLTFNYQWGTYDLAVKDNPNDDGFEPLYVWDDDVFRSPNLWNKLSTTSNQNNQKHENPDYVTIAGNTNKLMVKIDNVSYVNSPNNIDLRLFWTRARTGELWSNNWLYDMTNNIVTNPSGNPVAAGSEITISGATQANPYNTNSNPFKIQSIATGANYTMPFSAGVDWFPPNPADFDVNNGSMSGGAIPVICLLARINERSTNGNLDPISFQPTGLTDDILPYVKNNNNVATRNSWLVNSPQFRKRPTSGGVGTGWHHDFGTVVVNNPKATPVKVNLCIDILPVSGSVNNFNQHGFIEIGTTNGLYNQWLAGGSQVSNIVVQSPTLFKITNGTHACLNNITLPAGFQEQIGLRFQFINSLLPTSPIEFTYQLSQSTMDTTMELKEITYNDTAGNTDSIVNVYTPKIHPVYGSNTVYIVNVPTAPPIGWENAQVTTVKNNTKVQNNLIVYPNPSNTEASISMFNATNTKSILTITNIQGVVVYTSHYTKVGAFIETINTSLLASGIYNISYTNGKNTDRQKLTVIH